MRRIDDMHNKILKCVEEDVTLSEMCRRLKISRTALIYRLKALEEKGFLNHRKCVYEVTEYGKNYLN